jgi:hypothetical protein
MAYIRAFSVYSVQIYFLHNLSTKRIIPMQKPKTKQNHSHTKKPQRRYRRNVSTLRLTRTNKRHRLQRYQQSDRPTATSDCINNHIGKTDIETRRQRRRRYTRNVATNSEGITLLLSTLRSTRTNKRHRLQRY